jgi:hypothetical protein
MVAHNEILRAQHVCRVADIALHDVVWRRYERDGPFDDAHLAVGLVAHDDVLVALHLEGRVLACLLPRTACTSARAGDAAAIDDEVLGLGHEGGLPANDT